MAPLTYLRLVTRLNSLIETLPSQFPNPDDEARLHDVMRAVRAGQLSAQRGVDGEGDKVLTPGQLKQWVTAKVAKIHEKYDEDAAIVASKSAGADGIHIDQNDGVDDMEDIVESIEIPSPHTDSSKENAATKRALPAARPVAPPKTSAVTKRIIRGNNTYSGVKKTASKPTRKSTRKVTAKPRAPSRPTTDAPVAAFDDQDAAAALLQISHSSPVPGYERPALTAQTFAHLDIPADAYDPGAAPRSIFLAGLMYAMNNYDLVKGQMDGTARAERRGFWDVV
ncbi:hypothetical protein J1614_001367 [Plenodomus biglobosus]|nr:hypothetical protein J1614_001367 [Plenodomus biglobosus]